MSSSQMENSIKNSISAIVLKIFQILLPFVIRTIVIQMLGLSYVGISGLFTSIFGLLGIAELGVGNAMLHALYAPIEHKETDRINAIINFYRKAYWVIGVVILVFGLMLMPFLKLLIKEGTYPAELNLNYIYLVNLCSTVSSYLIYSYKALLLEAHQLGREANKVKIWVTFISYIVQIGILVWTKNYYMYVSIVPITTIVSAVWVGKVADKWFSDFRPIGKIGETERNTISRDIKALFLYKIGSVVNNNVDALVISWWFGAVILGIYNNYYYIVSSITMIILVIYSAVLPSVGNSVVSYTKEKIFQDFLYIVFIDAWVVGWCSICLCCLLEPFISLWVGNKSAFGTTFSILFAFYFYVWRFPDALSLYKDAAGLWNKDKWRPMCTAILNLILNIFFTQVIGIYGILISTIVSILTINFPISVKYVMDYFGKKYSIYLFLQLKYTAVTVINALLTYFLCSIIFLENPFAELLFKLCICVVFSNFVYVCIYRKNIYFRKMIEWISCIRGRNDDKAKNQANR